MVWRVTDDLGAALVVRVGRKAVFENHDVVVRLGDLGLGHPGPGRTERAVLGRGVVCAVLPPWRHSDPLFEEGVPAELTHAFTFVKSMRYRRSAFFTTRELSVAARWVRR